MSDLIFIPVPLGSDKAGRRNTFFRMSAAIVLLSQPQQVFRFEMVIHLTVVKQFGKTGVVIINIAVVQGWIRVLAYSPGLKTVTIPG